MNCKFIECNREQTCLLPPSLADWLPEGHLAWFIIDAVGNATGSCAANLTPAAANGR